MISPMKYSVYDQNGNEVKTFTAKDVNNIINPIEVLNAVEKYKETVDEELENLSKELLKLRDDTEKSLVVKGTNMVKTLESIAEQIKQTASIFYSKVNYYVDDAEKVHDNLQTEENEKAKEKANNYKITTN